MCRKQLIRKMRGGIGVYIVLYGCEGDIGVVEVVWKRSESKCMRNLHVNEVICERTKSAVDQVVHKGGYIRLLVVNTDKVVADEIAGF
jgi:hypothetical protein